MKIRQATTEDASQIAEIYAPFCESSPVSFETEAPTVQDMAQRIDKCNQRFPWLVCERDNVILGYAYSTPHRERAAYRWSVEASAYIKDGYRGMGIGRALYTALLELLRLQGFYRVYAGITLPNIGSVSLHESMGFTAIGVYEMVGYKAGAWRDVGRWGMELTKQADATPVEPLPVTAIVGTEDWERAIAAGTSMLVDPLTP